MKNKLTIVEDDEGHLCVEFTPEQMTDLGLKIGDVVEWNIIDSDSVSFKVVK